MTSIEVSHPRFTIVLPGAVKGTLSILRDLWLVDVQKALLRAGADLAAVERIERSAVRWQAQDSVIDDKGSVHFFLLCTGRVVPEEREQKH